MRTKENQTTESNFTILSSVTDIDTAYRTLAAAVVAQAARDYTKCLVKPNFYEEERQIEEIRGRFNALRKEGRNILETGADGTEYVAKVGEELETFNGYDPHVFSPSKRFKSLRNLKEAIAAGEVQGVVTALDRLAVWAQSKKEEFTKATNNRTKTLREIERFCNSGQMEYYTGGYITPKDFKKACEERAEKIRAGEKFTDGIFI